MVCKLSFKVKVVFPVSIHIEPGEPYMNMRPNAPSNDNFTLRWVKDWGHASNDRPRLSMSIRQNDAGTECFSSSSLRF